MAAGFLLEDINMGMIQPLKSTETFMGTKGGNLPLQGPLNVPTCLKPRAMVEVVYTITQSRTQTTFIHSLLQELIPVVLAACPIQERYPGD